MSHDVKKEAPKTTMEALSTARVSLNAQVSGFSGNPNPTLLSLLSSGTIGLGAMVAGISFNGNFGGD